MKKTASRSLALTFFMFFTFSVAANQHIVMSDESIDKLNNSFLKIDVCNFKTRAEIQRSQRLFKVWLGNETKSGYNIYKKLKAISELHQDYFDYFSKMIGRDVKKMSMAQILDSLKKVDSLQSVPLNKISTMGAQELALERSLYHVEYEIGSIKNKLNHLSKHCHSHKEVLASVKNELDQWHDQLNTLRTYLHKAAKERVEITTASLLHWKALLKTSLQERNNLKRSKLLADIEATLNLEKFVMEFQKIKKAYFKADIPNLMLREFKFKEPFYHLGVFIQKLQVHRKKISKTPQILQKQIISEIDIFKNIVQEKLTQLESIGWKGQLSNQLRKVSLLVKGDCKEAARELGNRLSVVDNLSSFISIEGAYAELEDHCHAK